MLKSTGRAQYLLASSTLEVLKRTLLVAGFRKRSLQYKILFRDRRGMPDSNQQDAGT